MLVAVYFAASAFGAMAHVRLFATDDVSAPVSTDTPGTRPRRAEKRARARREHRRQLVTAVTERNVFCPTCVPEPAGGVTRRGESEEARDGDMWVTWSDGTIIGRLLQPGEPKTELPLELVATMVAEPLEHSLVTIVHDEQGQAGLFGRGDHILENVSIYEIGAGLVHLDNRGALEYLPLEEPKQKRRRRKRRKKKKRSKKKRRKSRYEIAGARDAIDCDGKTTCTIERSFVNKLIKNPALLAKQARIRPSRKDGDMRGYKVYGVRRGTIPRLLKLRNGDLLTSVNGHALDSMDAAMKLYQQLRNASHLRVGVNRRGKELEMHYDIR